MKLKMIVAALAFAASGSANALIVDGSGGNGELFMTVLDSVGLKSYTLDMNLTMNDFLAGVAANQSYSYAADANMTSFLAGVSSLSNLTFAIAAMDASGATATDYHRYITTSTNIVPGNTLTNQITNTSLKNLGTSGAQLLGDTNTLIGTANSVIVTDPGAVAYAGSALWGTNWGGRANFNAVGMIGDGIVTAEADLGMYFLRQTTGATVANPALNQGTKASIYEALNGGNGFQYFADLSTDGNLNIAYAAPIPEADTYALMLAGLGLVGFMVRRRRNAA